MILSSEKFPVILKSIDYNDAINMSVTGSDKDIAKNTAEYGKFPYPYKVSDAINFIAYSLNMQKIKMEFNFAMYEKDTEKFLGLFGIFNIDYFNKKAEIGYWLGKKYWGEGLGSIGIRMLLNYSFNNLNLNKIYAKSFVFNLRSIHLMESLKFVKEAELRDEVKIGGRYKNLVIYSILKKEYYLKMKKYQLKNKV